jgi:hypothetical protein
LKYYKIIETIKNINCYFFKKKERILIRIKSKKRKKIKKDRKKEGWALLDLASHTHSRQTYKEKVRHEWIETTCLAYFLFKSERCAMFFQ